MTSICRYAHWEDLYLYISEVIFGNRFSAERQRSGPQAIRSGPQAIGETGHSSLQRNWAMFPSNEIEAFSN